ncbi:hypothetical protein HYFRA_00008203 [Hymenoscyphus fraxineus]|uniref:Zn(2)-C6 fungal-type domain-containing protein n=1 Tax=Hymenoscyphus fraxineus TaxID=746836 RepID=A0A9N9PN73_9HELO|nr:hypothetical protein HYFRA_00008203 [Hymenoscyphus fraxineus]
MSEKNMWSFFFFPEELLSLHSLRVSGLHDRILLLDKCHQCESETEHGAIHGVNGVDSSEHSNWLRGCFPITSSSESQLQEQCSYKLVLPLLPTWAYARRALRLLGGIEKLVFHYYNVNVPIRKSVQEGRSLIPPLRCHIRTVLAPFQVANEFLTPKHRLCKSRTDDILCNLDHTPRWRIAYQSNRLTNTSSMSVTIAPSTNSPTTTSPESNVDDDPNSMQSSAWQASSPASGTPISQTPRVNPLQKRRRVTRACDECRRKKIKCDGKQPCTHCTVYSYDCSYDQPSNRRRNPAPQYIESLEKRLQKAEVLLRTFLPDVDLDDPNIDAVIADRQGQASDAKISQSRAAEAEQDAQLSSMIALTGQLDLDEEGRWDFHGGSSGTVFHASLRAQFGDLLGNDEKPGTPFLPKRPRENPLGITNPSASVAMDLPSKETALALCANSLNYACALLRFVHQPTFYEMVDRIYDPSSPIISNELALLYVVIGLGSIFDTDKLSHADVEYKEGLNRGLIYFQKGRGMVDITDCRDIVSLQTILFMILFLQSSSNLSTCYSYIGIALRSALRMGLHRNLTHSHKFNPIEREVRRRLFWIVRKMDTYVSALLGFPQMLSTDDIDQVLPIEVDDEYITKDSILPMPPGKTSLYAASNAHTALMAILADVIKYIYPTKGVEQSVNGNNSSTYVISHIRIREIEKDLRKWQDQLPMQLRPGGDASPDVLRVQQLLRLAYAHVQMMLYRPFLHYVSHKASSGKALDERSYACAAACVSVSRNIVHITTEMKKRGLLLGAYWFTMYTTFFFYVIEQPDSDRCLDILKDANDGKDALVGLARMSQAADRCSAALKPLFERLPKRLKKNRQSIQGPRNKRSAPSPTIEPQTSSVSQLSRDESFAPAITSIIRARTFPTPPAVTQTRSPRASLDGSRFTVKTSSNPNLRHTEKPFSELLTPSDMSRDMSSAGTPESSNTNNSFSHPYPQPTLTQNMNNASLPDMSAMMFSTEDPFAYPPSHPMMEYDSNMHHMDIKPENMLGFQLPDPSIYMVGNGTGAPDLPLYDDLEGQIFGPLPPYIVQSRGGMYRGFECGAQGGMDLDLDLDADLDVGVDAGVMEGIGGGNQNRDLGFGSFPKLKLQCLYPTILNLFYINFDISAHRPHKSLLTSQRIVVVPGDSSTPKTSVPIPCGVNLKMATLQGAPLSPTQVRMSRLIVQEPPKFDLETYIQNYEGRTRYDRLIHIGLHSAFIGVDALKLAVREAKAGKDTKRYRDAVAHLQTIGNGEPEAELDKAWVEKQDKMNAEETRRAEAELKGYKNNLIKESIRMGNEDLGKHYQAMGELQRAQEAYNRMRTDVSNAKHIIDVCKHQIDISVEMKQWIAVTSNAQKIRGAMSEEPIQPYVAAAEGLSAFEQGDYVGAAMLFLSTEPGMGRMCAAFISPNDVAIYGGLCALATMDRNELQRRVLENSNFRTYLELEPQIRRAIGFFINCRYTSCLAVLESYRADYLLDYYMNSHIDSIYQMVRVKCIVNYFIPFSKVTLASLNEAFAAPGKTMNQELLGMIKCGELDARINLVDGLLEARKTNPRQETFREALDLAEEFQKESRRRIFHMSIKMANLEVVPLKGRGINNQSFGDFGDQFAGGLGSLHPIAPKGSF